MQQCQTCADVKRQAALAFVALVSALVVVSGCGGSKNAVRTEATAQTTTPSRAELARTYLSIVRPVNEAAHHYNNLTVRWTLRTKGKKAAKDAAPVAAALHESDEKLLRVNWPPETAADVKKLVRADRALIRDFRGYETWTCCP